MNKDRNSFKQNCNSRKNSQYLVCHIAKRKRLVIRCLARRKYSEYHSTIYSTINTINTCLSFAMFPETLNENPQAPLPD